MGRKNRGSQIPDGWQECPSMGTGFVDDRFFVFKTPLTPDLNNKVPQSDRFTIDHIFQRMEHLNHSRIGLWIDLTNTSRYYNPAQILDRGVHYEKLACEGHGRPPSRHTIFRFCSIVHHFFKSNRRDYIGVHCTHGFNRTGYLICCYLIQFRKYSAAEALEEFSRHRQPGIYRQIYVNDLYTMSYPREVPIQVSEPQWLLRGSQELQVPMRIGASSSTSQGTFCEDPVATASNSETKESEFVISHTQPGSSVLALLTPTRPIADSLPMASTSKPLTKYQQSS